MPTFWLVMILLVILVISLPVYPYSRTWGYVPSGAVGLVLLTMLILVWFGLLAFHVPGSGLGE